MTMLASPLPIMLPRPIEGAPTDPAAFVRWAEGREGRFELAGGQVTMMVGATIRHEKVVATLAHLLLAALDPAEFTVASGGLAVEIGEGIRYPDVVVHEGSFDPHDLVSSRPVLVAEVLSPSSLTVDMLKKPAEYGAVETIHTYLVLAQDTPRVWIWQRERGSFPGTPIEAVGAEDAVALPEFGLMLPLADIYAGMPG
jgi:Uma2 family endonuclease